MWAAGTLAHERNLCLEHQGNFVATAMVYVPTDDSTSQVVHSTATVVPPPIQDATDVMPTATSGEARAPWYQDTQLLSAAHAGLPWFLLMLFFLYNIVKMCRFTTGTRRASRKLRSRRTWSPLLM